jgi:hypothetical protein
VQVRGDINIYAKWRCNQPPIVVDSFRRKVLYVSGHQASSIQPRKKDRKNTPHQHAPSYPKILPVSQSGHGRLLPPLSFYYPDIRTAQNTRSSS